MVVEWRGVVWCEIEEEVENWGSTMVKRVCLRVRCCVEELGSICCGRLGLPPERKERVLGIPDAKRRFTNINSFGPRPTAKRVIFEIEVDNFLAPFSFRSS